MQLNLSSFSYKGFPFCKRCGSTRVKQNGCYRGSGARHFYKCRQCNYQFVPKSDLPRMRHHSSVVAFAVELYSSAGISLRSITLLLEEHFKVKVSFEIVRQWLLKCSGFSFPALKLVFSPVWHADETYVKIKGVGHWLWLMYCRESGAIIAWHLSKTRFLPDASAFCSKAKENAGMRPQTIITDGLWQYKAAIKKIFGYRYVKHVIDSGIGKNAPIERVNEEVKRRIKWFRTFQALECAKIFISVWIHQWNKRKKCTTTNIQTLLKGYPALQTH